MANFNFSGSGLLPLNHLPDDSLITLNNALVSLASLGEFADEQLRKIEQSNDSHIYDAVGFMRQSIEGARGATFPTIAYLANRYPHIRLFSGQRIPLDEVAQAQEYNRIDSIAESISGAETIFAAAGSTITKATLAGRITDDNISQTARMEAMQVRPTALRLYTSLSHWLGGWCQRNDYRFEMRPSISFPSRFYQDLRLTAPTRGITNPWMYQSTAMGQCLESLPAPMIPQVTVGENPIIALNQFNVWDKITGTARLVPTATDRDSYRPQMILTSHDVPNLWLGQCIDFLPVGIGADLKMPLPFDRVKTIVNWHPDDGYDLIRSAAYYTHESWEEMQKAQMALMLIPALISIHTSTAKTGKGFTKPSWIHSPLNVTVIQMIMLLSQALVDMTE